MKSPYLYKNYTNIMAIQTSDLEELSIHVAAELSEKLGVPSQRVVEELLKFQSLIRSIIGSRINEAHENVVAKFGGNRDLQNELSSILENF